MPEATPQVDARARSGGRPPQSTVVVTRLSLTPVKGTHLVTVDRLDLDPGGVRGDRRFFIIDARGRMVNAKALGELQTVGAEAPDGRLRLHFPDGSAVEDAVALGAPVDARFYSEPVRTRLVEGPFSEALSRHVGQPLRLVSGGAGIDRGRRGGISLISRASVDRLASEAGEDAIDSRRFRMSVEIDGVAAHAEDAWVGRTLRIGAARVRFHGEVGRCLITSRDPDTGVIDLPTLDLLRSYRGALDTTEPLPFGIYGEVVDAAPILLGDPVELID